MKPYGRLRGDCRCCPGHDKFPSETYRSRRSKRAQTRDTKIQHQRARTHASAELRQQLIDK